MDLISVIVPVYKVEPYLDKCVQSIVEQTYRNLEIILVDDGSPDNCGAMCDAWARRDGRIRVIHQANAGGGAARNAGLDIAQGAWIAFADSDDYLHPEMYAHLLSLTQTGADVVECDYMSVTGDAAFLGADLPAQQFTAQEAMREHIHDRIFRQLLWNKLYRREIVGDIRFPAGTQIDDEFFVYRVLGAANKLTHSEKICYAYRQQPGSIMHNLDPQKRFQAIEAKCQRHQYLEKYFPDLVPESLVNLWFSCMYQGQLVLNCPTQKDPVISKLKAVLDQHPIHALPQNLSATHRVWLMLANLSFTAVCRLRNLLQVGL